MMMAVGTMQAHKLILFVLSIWSIVFLTNGLEDASSRATSPDKLPSICETSCKSNTTLTHTSKFCKKHPSLEMQHRCCVNTSTSAVVGIDLQKCDLKRDDFVQGIKNLSQLKIISIQDNPITEVKNTDFGDNTGILYLSMPHENGHCPGGDDVWREAKNSSATVLLCLHELNSCHVHNVTCPDNSNCVPKGVNMVNCLCDEGYHGYKCMKKGHFPFMYYGIGISIPTALVCLFLWVTQRRYVVEKPKDE